MELAYLYINKFKNFEKKAIQLSNSIKFNHDFVNEKIKIVSNEIEKSKRIDSFFGSNIKNLNVIVGANGAGKSSLLDLISRELVFGGASNEIRFFAIFNVEEEIKIYAKGYDSSLFFLNGNPVENFIDNIDFDKYHTIIFSSVSDLTFSNDYLSNNIGSNRSNISDNALLTKSYESNSHLFAKSNGLNSASFKSVTNNFYASEIKLQLNFFNHQGYNHISRPDKLALILDDNLNYIESGKLITLKALNSKNEDVVRLGKNFDALLDTLYARSKYFLDIPHLKDDWENIMHFYLFVGCFVDSIGNYAKLVSQLGEEDFKKLNIPTKFNELVNRVFSILNNGNVQLSFNEGINELKNIMITLGPSLVENIEKSIRFNEQLMSYPDDLEKNVTLLNNATLVFSFDYKKNHDFIDDLLNEFVEIDFATNIFQFQWRGTDIVNSSFSTGELQIIKLFSRIDSILRKHPNKPILLLIDEIDLGLHPEWQKKTIKWLLDYLNSKDNSFQVIIASHSPLLLSDIPTPNVILLGENGKIKRIDTFGANIHELLAHDFFLKDGFMGEFAKEKIKETIEWLKDDKRDSNERGHHEALIKMIGEPILKSKLSQMFDKIFKADLEIKLLEEKISLLKKTKNDQS